MESWNNLSKSDNCQITCLQKGLQFRITWFGSCRLNEYFPVAGHLENFNKKNLSYFSVRYLFLCSLFVAIRRRIAVMIASKVAHEKMKTLQIHLLVLCLLKGIVAVVEYFQPSDACLVVLLLGDVVFVHLIPVVLDEMADVWLLGLLVTVDVLAVLLRVVGAVKRYNWKQLNLLLPHKTDNSLRLNLSPMTTFRKEVGGLCERWPLWNYRDVMCYQFWAKSVEIS